MTDGLALESLRLRKVAVPSESMPLAFTEKEVAGLGATIMSYASAQEGQSSQEVS